MNKLIRKYVATILVFLTLVCCIGCQKQTTTESPEEEHSLVDEFSKDWLQIGRDKFTFHDVVTKKKYLQDGWLFDENPGKSRFPWPRFTETGGTILLKWTQRMERRVKVRLVNLNPSYPTDFLAMSLNGHAVTQMKDKLPPGEYEFYLPSSYQISGENQISISIRSGIFTKPVEYNSIGLHSLGVTLGAVVKSTIRIGNQTRNSLLFAPPITLEIPYQSNSRQFFQFSHGLYSFQSEKQSAEYLLTIALCESGKSKPLVKKEIPIHRGSNQKPDWKFAKLKLPALEQEGVLKISFRAKPNRTVANDFLALSEIFLKNRRKNWSLKLGNNEPDVMLVSLSSVSTGQIGAYGNPDARTPFLDQLSKIGILHSDMSASTNDENGSLASIATGKYPRDHGFYRSNHTISDRVTTFPEMILTTQYQSHGFIHSTAESQALFSQISGFRRVYLSNPQKDPLSIVRDQFANVVSSPYLQSNPGFYWVHLSPELCSPSRTEPIFPLEIYSDKKASISSLNLPVSEQERLIRCLGDKSVGDDLRILLSSNDERLYLLDKFIEKMIIDFIGKRKKRSVALVVSADHGIIRSIDSNVLSADSLAQEVIHVPFIMTMIGKDIQPNQKQVKQLFTSPISNTKIFDILGNLIRNPDATSASSVFDQSTNRNTISPIFSEHSQRPIVAFRKNNHKFIHCLSDPYFQIATTNLFDLEENPSETVNLGSRDPAYSGLLLKPVLAFCRGSSFYPEPRPGFEDEAMDILEALNYTTQ